MPVMRAFLAILLVLVTSSASLADNGGKIIIKPDLSPAQMRSGLVSGSTPGINLAISGGGARGLAVIGILKVLEREHIRINFIAGVSMGSIVGGLYSCGYTPEEIEQIANQTNWLEILSSRPYRKTLLTTQKGQAEKSLFRIGFQGWKPVMPRAITSAQRLSQFLDKLTARGGIRSSISFDYLNPPLRVVCTDLLNGERVVLSSGSLGEAMRASAAVPVAFTPAEIDGRLLVDGGLVDPIPVDVVLDQVGHPVVAINVTSDLLPQSAIGDVIGVADQTTTIMAMDKKRDMIAKADLCIAPDLRGRTAMDFSHIDSLISAGERAAEKALPAIRELLARGATEENDDPVYKISQTQISDLALMPRTFFLKTFADSAAISNGIIESNLRNAMTSGYLKDAWAEITPETSGAILNYHLIDNPRISEIKFEGAEIFEPSYLSKFIESAPGGVLNTGTLERDEKALDNRYIKSGYNLARVISQFDTLTGVLTFKIDEGRINAVRIEGNRKTRGWVITRHLPLKSGEVFEQKNGEKAIDGIFGTGLFETAKLIAIPDTSGSTLLVKVRERQYNYIRGGARFDLEYNAQAFVDFVADNVLGSGQEMYLSAYVGEKRRSLALNYHFDRILETFFTNTMSVGYTEFKRNIYQRHKYDGYSRITSYGGMIAPGRQFPQLGMISIVGQFWQYNWDERGKPGTQRFTKLGLGVQSIVDTRDDISFPRTGKYHYFDLQLASDLNSGKKAYTRFETTLEMYWPLTNRLNLHPRLTMAVSSDIMPYFDAFSLGGLHNFLGLHQDEFLGDKMVIGSLELRQRIGDRFYVMARYNAGNIWNNLERVRLSRLMEGAGFGFGLKTPIGPIESWYGRTDAGLDMFYLDIGYDW